MDTSRNFEYGLLVIRKYVYDHLDYPDGSVDEATAGAGEAERERWRAQQVEHAQLAWEERRSQ